MLPDLIEIIPPASPPDATVVLPGSKRLIAGALVLAALVAVRIGGLLYRRAIVRTGHRLRVREVLAG